MERYIKRKRWRERERKNRKEGERLLAFPLNGELILKQQNKTNNIDP